MLFLGCCWSDGNIINGTQDFMQIEEGSDHTNVVASLFGDNGIHNAWRDTQENKNMFSVPQTSTMKRKQRSVDSPLVSKHLKQTSDVLWSLVKKPNLQKNQNVTDGPELYE